MIFVFVVTCASSILSTSCASQSLVREWLISISGTIPRKYTSNAFFCLSSPMILMAILSLPDIFKRKNKHCLTKGTGYLMLIYVTTLYNSIFFYSLVTNALNLEHNYHHYNGGVTTVYIGVITVYWAQLFLFFYNTCEHVILCYILHVQTHASSGTKSLHFL